MTAATVIPVLYLALTLQGSTFAGIVRRVGETIRRHGSQRPLLGLIPYVAIATPALLILFWGLAGEWVAIVGLYNRSKSLGTATFVLIAVILLLIAVITGPTIRFVTTVTREMLRPYGESGELTAVKTSQSPSNDSEESE